MRFTALYLRPILFKEALVVFWTISWLSSCLTVSSATWTNDENRCTAEGYALAVRERRTEEKRRIAITPRKSAPKRVTLLTVLMMKSEVGLPGLIPGIVPPLFLMLFAISTGYTG